jgi:hypothetical protein
VKLLSDRRPNDCAEEFIAAAARSGFSMEDLAQAEQVHDAEKYQGKDHLSVV